MTTLARQNPAKQPSQVTIYSSPRTCRDSETAEFLSAAGHLWLAGVEIDWAALHGGSPRRRVPLPTYPFERKRHWIEPHRPSSSVTSYTNGAGSTLDTDVTQSVAEPSSELEALIQEQLRIMAKQIEVLRHAPASSDHNRSIQP